MKSGEGFGIEPCGLGARDTLRQEMGFPLYGFELSEETSPIEAGLKKFISFNKGDFLGCAALEKELRVGSKKRLVALEVTDSGIARTGYGVIKNGKRIGEVTSGTLSPTLKRAIAMAYVDNDLRGLSLEDGELFIEIRGKEHRAAITKKPFYRREAGASAV
jgi:aminomethyltransferase